MLIQRVITAIVLLIVFTGSLFVHWSVFASLATLVLILSAWEWSQLSGLQHKNGRLAYVAVLFLLFLTVAISFPSFNGMTFALSTGVFGVWILLIPLLIVYPVSSTLFRNTAFATALGAVILVSSASGLLWLHAKESGAWWVLLLIFVVTIADSGAYFSGRAFGKTPLAPKISPAKTYEGVYGGLFANFLLAVALCLVLKFSLERSAAMVAIIMMTSLFSVEGDLLESAVKRSSGVKDSGQILPGHGGILDRVDGLCAATACFVFGILLAGF